MLWSLLWACGTEPTTAPEVASPAPPEAAAERVRLHWFIPDGTRADPELFDVFRWAEEGKLPNLKKLMDRGAYGFSRPTFPSHTPTNFATLLTGAFPSAHGVADGPMHVEGNPLSAPSVGGFRSAARKLPAAWSVLEDAGYGVFLLSMPGSTPPELGDGSQVVRGRWGGWGADFASLLFENANPERQKAMGRVSRLFLLQDELTRFVPTTGGPGDWQSTLEGYGVTIPVQAADSDGDGDADVVRASFGDETVEVAKGGWSDWQAVDLDWKGTPVPSHMRLSVIRLEADGSFRLRLQVDQLNKYVTQPSSVSGQLHEDVGPMVDFVDNFPAQLVYFPEDKQAFLDEAHHSLDWHRDAVSSIYDNWQPDAVFHDIYTPNQVLTSRWWMGGVDPASDRYDLWTDAEREELWAEVHGVYQKLDAILGEAMERAGDDAVVVFSSDHGAAPVNHTVNLNDLFAQKGWLATKPDPVNGAPVVDWDNTKVVFLNMYSVHLHPDGLAGDWTRGSGEAYEALREEVRTALLELKDPDGNPAVASVLDAEDAKLRNLPEDRVGDLIVANHAGYGWSEELTDDHEIFQLPLVSGYKQAIEPDTTKAVWTPFVIAGPGVKAGTKLEEPIRHIDQLPTILTLLGQPIPEHVEGRVLTEALE